MGKSFALKKKSQGGVGGSELELMNLALLMKWWWKPVDTPDKIIGHILKDEYNHRLDIWTEKNRKNRNTSQSWKGLR